MEGGSPEEDEMITYQRTLQPNEDDRGALRVWGFGDRARVIRITISDPVDGITTIKRHAYLADGGEISPRGMTIGTCPDERRDAALAQIVPDLLASGYTKVD